MHPVETVGLMEVQPLELMAMYRRYSNNNELYNSSIFNIHGANRDRANGVIATLSTSGDTTPTIFTLTSPNKTLSGDKQIWNTILP